MSRLFKGPRAGKVKNYEPSPRRSHCAASLEGLVYTFAGDTDDFVNDKKALSRRIEVFDPLIETWMHQDTRGEAPLGLVNGAFAPRDRYLYHYGGHDGGSWNGDLSRFCPATMLWTNASRHSASGPMKKNGCRMISCGDTLGLFGGFGTPTGQLQPGSTFVEHHLASDGSGFTDEFHIFDINKDVWSCPVTTGTRPTPRAFFSFNEIDDHRGVLFAGQTPGFGRTNDTYLVDLQLMEWSKLDLDGGPVPVERSDHASCCINVGDDHPLLLVTGGLDKDYRVLKDAWLLDIVARRWTELTGHWSFQPRFNHSLTATSLAPGITVVTSFGGAKKWGINRIAETALLQFEKEADHWKLTDLTFNNHRGSKDRLREKRKKVDATALATLEPRATLQHPNSIFFKRKSRSLLEHLPTQEQEHALKQRAQGAETKIQDLEKKLKETEQRAQDAERREQATEKKLHKAEQQAVEATWREQEMEQMLRSAEQRVEDTERKQHETERRLHKAELHTLEPEWSSESRAMERVFEQQAQKAEGASKIRQDGEERDQALRQRLQQAERETREAEQQKVLFQQRLLEAETATLQAQQASDDANRLTLEVRQNLELAERTVEELQASCQMANERIQQLETEVVDLRKSKGRTMLIQELSQTLQQSQSRVVELQTANENMQSLEGEIESVRRQMSDLRARLDDEEELQRRVEELETQWVVERGEIQLTEEEKGRGGWAVVRVANFRGLRVAAKCMHEQIREYYRDLFIREMNMAARLRHPNLVQFVGATLQGEMIILSELMPTSLRAVLEQRAISHDEITSISLDVARALNYLHLTQPEPLIHRDISSANVLLEPGPNNSWKAKVSDYGSVNLQRQLRTIGPGSPVYAAPEANTTDQQSPNMDIFSFGVLLIEMCTARFPEVAARQRLIRSIQYPHFVELIGRCMSREIDSRPSASEIITQLTQLPQL